MLFDSFEAYDVQETRKVSREEGRIEGRLEILVPQICKKLKRNLTSTEIADILEEDLSAVQDICDVAQKYAPAYDTDKIIAELMKSE